jgi:hypothetical protein
LSELGGVVCVVEGMLYLFVLLSRGEFAGVTIVSRFVISSVIWVSNTKRFAIFALQELEEICIVDGDGVEKEGLWFVNASS